jgi:hypothetical protein
VSGEASAQAAQSAANNVIRAAQNEGKQDAATKPAQPGVTVNISPEGAAAASRAQITDQANVRTATAPTDTGTDTDTDTPDSAVTDSDIADPSATDDATGGTEASPANVSPVKAFAYGALGLERPDQPQDERNSFYTAGKWLAAGLTIGGLISLLA